MKLKKEIVQKINNVAARRNIGTRLNLSDQTVQKTLKLNATNNRLTRADALLAISQEVKVKNLQDLIEA
jgi:hypothetical protein